jgi:hypothetical protein
MGPYFHLQRGARFTAFLAVALALAGVVAATAATVAAAGEPPCPSCPDRYPPPAASGGGGNGSQAAPAAQPAAPLVSLGPIALQGGVASVTGVVNAVTGGSGNATANVQVTVNGQGVAVSAGGQFSSSTKVGSDTPAGIVVQASDPAIGESYTISIPVSAISSGGTPSDALAQVNADRVTVMLPPDGFTTVDGIGTSATVQVNGTTAIASLQLNGTNLLAELRAGSSTSSQGSGSPPPPKPKVQPGVNPPPPSASGHTASAPVSGTARHVKMTVTATNGASQTSIFIVKRVRSVIRVGRQLSISAFGARGIRVTSIRFRTTRSAQGYRLGIAVTVRDRRNYLIRDAVVMLQPQAHRLTIGGSVAELSGMNGRASFSLPIRKTSLDHRLYLAVVARTPLAHTRVKASVLVSGAVR